MLERADKAGFATKESFSPIQTPRLLGGRKLRLFFGTSGRKSLLKVGRRTRGDLGFFPLPPPLSDTGVNWLTKKRTSDEMSSFLRSFFIFCTSFYSPSPWHVLVLGEGRIEQRRGGGRKRCCRRKERDPFSFCSFSSSSSLFPDLGAIKVESLSFSPSSSASPWILLTFFFCRNLRFGKVGASLCSVES